MDNVTVFYLRILDQFGAWLARKCWHTGHHEGGIYIPDRICQKCLKEAEYREPNTTYTADPKAMLDDVIEPMHNEGYSLVVEPVRAAIKATGCHTWVLRQGQSTYYPFFGESPMSMSQAFCVSILMALLNSPKGEQFRQERGI